MSWCSPPDEPVPCTVHVAGLGTGAPIIESPYGDPVNPEDAPESISRAVASLPPEQMFELMKQMKVSAGGPCSLCEHSSFRHCLHPPSRVTACQSSDQCLSPQLCVQNSPQEARNMLLQNPQLAYALLQAQVVMRIVDPEIALVCPLLLVRGSEGRWEDILEDIGGSLCGMAVEKNFFFLLPSLENPASPDQCSSSDPRQPAGSARPRAWARPGAWAGAQRAAEPPEHPIIPATGHSKSLHNT